MARLILLGLLIVCYPFSSSLQWHGDAWQLWTYAFAHASLPHLILNAITLWSFGRVVEMELGAPQTIALFVVASVCAGALQTFAVPDASLAGASAGIFGMVTAYACCKPDARVRVLMLPLGIKAALALIVAASLACIAFGWLPGIAHLAHLTGIAVGYFWTRR